MDGCTSDLGVAESNGQKLLLADCKLLVKLSCQTMPSTFPKGLV
jgi:hypothetical protein